MNFPAFGGMRIVESVMATQRGERVKVYPKRKAKSPSHWRRMDKKWLKRYGHKQEPCMYRMAGGIVGGETLVVHPSLMPQLRAALRR